LKFLKVLNFFKTLRKSVSKMVADLDPKFQKPQIVSTKYDKSRTGNWWNPLKETKRGYNLKTLNGGIVSKKFG